MKSRKVSQAELAARIDCSESMLSRFLSGRTDKLGDESVIRIARVFNVSTDFLLGETDVPDCVTYDVSELGLSVQAARNLYTQKVNPKVVNALLENPAFAETTELIYGFLNDEFAKGIPHTTLRARSCAKETPSPLDSPANETGVSLDSSSQRAADSPRVILDAIPTPSFRLLAAKGAPPL